MDFSLTLAFLGASILLSLMPGPDNIYVISESLSRGAKSGILISIGLVSGVLIHTAAAATGLSILIYQSEKAFQIVSYVGAAYLIYLAFLASKEKPLQLVETNIRSNQQTIWAHISKGFIMNVTNPKVSLFFIAFLPQFISDKGLNQSIQMLILGLIFIIQAFLVFSTLALLAGRLSIYLNQDRFWTITKWVKVGILGVLAISLLY